MLCELCQSDDAYNFHHFIPRTLHRNKWFRKRFTREEMQEGINVCTGCHTTIHDTFSEKELGRDYRSLPALRGHVTIAKYVAWKVRRAARRRT